MAVSLLLAMMPMKVMAAEVTKDASLEEIFEVYNIERYWYITPVKEIANPIMEVESFEKLQSYFNTTIPKLDKKVDSYIAIGINGYAGHARIRYSDGTSFEMDLTSEDASGISGGILIKEEKINGITVKFYNYDGINYTNWTKNKISYSYQNNGGEINETELEELLNQ